MTYIERASQSGKPKIAKKPAVSSVPQKSRLAGARDTRLVFFGNERLATGLKSTEPLTLKMLIAHHYNVVAVISHYHEGRSRSSRKLEIAEVASKHGIPVLTPSDLLSHKEEVKSFGAQAAILVAYGKIIPQEIIDLFPSGIINIHPSLLPLYRGPTPIEQAILDGVNETGVSIMSLSAGMDTGPVFAQSKVALTGKETKPELASELLELGGRMLIEVLPGILDGSIVARPQDNDQVSITSLIKKQDGLVNWAKPADVIERKIRAYTGFPKSRTILHGHEVVITAARVALDGSDGSLVVKCTPGWLEVLELIGPSGRTMSGADFLRGYPN